MHSKESKSQVVIKIPPGSSFDMLKVELIAERIHFNHSEMRNLIFYSDLNPLIIREVYLINELIKQYYFRHRNDGGKVYDFLEPEYVLWQLGQLIELRNIRIC